MEVNIKCAILYCLYIYNTK